MNYITTTQLRTNTTKLVDALMAGHSVQLIHRSQVLGVISPPENKPAQPFDAKKYLELTKNLKTTRISDAQRKKNYDEYIQKKYGKHIS
ncbi:hypothetical protein KBD69_00850 [Candidatus Woesebacteria bacterium]|nr:hypothetical protein [Candidatus Woesebacteria bacterium]